MYENVNHILRLWLPESRCDTMLDSLQLLGQLDQFGAWNNINNPFQTATDESTFRVIDTTTSILHDGMDTVLRDHGVFYEGELKSKNVILTALLRLPDWDDPESILATIGAGEDCNEVFGDLVALVTDVRTVDFMPGLIKIYPSLLDKIQEHAEETLSRREPPEEPLHLPEDRIKLIKYWLATYPHSLATRRYRTDRVKLGTDIHALITPVESELQAYQPTDEVHAAEELIGLMLLTAVDTDKMTTEARVLLDTLYDNTAFVVKVSNLLDKTLAALRTGLAEAV